MLNCDRLLSPNCTISVLHRYHSTNCRPISGVLHESRPVSGNIVHLNGDISVSVAAIILIYS